MPWTPPLWYPEVWETCQALWTTSIRNSWPLTARTSGSRGPAPSCRKTAPRTRPLLRISRLSNGNTRWWELWRWKSNLQGITDLKIFCRDFFRMKKPAYFIHVQFRIITKVWHIFFKLTIGVKCYWKCTFYKIL